MSFKRSIRLLLIVFTLSSALPAHAGWWDDFSSWVSSAAQKVTVSVQSTFNTPEKRGWGVLGLAAVGLLAWLGFTWKKKDDKPPASPQQPPVQPQPIPQPVPPVVPEPPKKDAEKPVQISQPPAQPALQVGHVSAEKDPHELSGDSNNVSAKDFVVENNNKPTNVPAEPGDLVPKAPDNQPLNNFQPSENIPTHVPVVPTTPMRGAPANPNPAASPVPFSPVPVTPDVRHGNFGGKPAVALTQLPALVDRPDSKSFSPPASPQAVAKDLTSSEGSLESNDDAHAAVTDLYPFETYCADIAAAENEFRLYKQQDLPPYEDPFPDDLSSSSVLVSPTDIPSVQPNNLPAAAACRIARRVFISPASCENKDRILLVCVHGTFSGPASFGEDDKKPLSQAVEKFARCLAQTNQCPVEIVSFKWSGKLSEEDRNDIAAQALVTEIFRLHERARGFNYGKVWSIAHSHGCNVINRTAEILATQREKKISFDTCVHIASPAPDNQEILKHIKKLYHFYGSMDFTQGAGSLASTWREWTRKYPISKDKNSIRYNIRLSADGIDLNHITIKVPVVAYLPQLIYMIESNYPQYCDLDANVVMNGKLPQVTIRDISARAMLPCEPKPRAMLDAITIMASIKHDLFKNQRPLLTYVAEYVGADAFSLLSNAEQSKIFSALYKRDIRIKPHLLYRMATMLLHEARSKDADRSGNDGGTKTDETRILVRAKSEDFVSLNRKKPNPANPNVASSSAAAAAAAAAQAPAKK